MLYEVITSVHQAVESGEHPPQVGVRSCPLQSAPSAEIDRQQSLAEGQLAAPQPPPLRFVQDETGELRRVVQDLHEAGRITSYNVCYTKLLRQRNQHNQPAKENTCPFEKFFHSHSPSIF